MMAKERLIERYGDIRYTIGTGCSGGSITQQTVANAYPGAVYDGLIVTCAYPDALTARRAVRRLPPAAPVLRGPGSGARRRLDRRPVGPRSRAGPTPSTRSPPTSCSSRPRTRPDRRLRRPPSSVYDPDTQPGRRALLDPRLHDQRARPAARERVVATWSSRAGRGFAGMPFGNDGIQYGLERARAGADHARAVRRPQREDRRLRHRPPADAASASPATTGAVANAYRSGRDQRGQQPRRTSRSSTTPGPTPASRTTTRTRGGSATGSTRAQGHHDNHVLWYGPTPLIGDLNWPNEALHRDGPLAGRRRGRQVQAPAARRRSSRDRPDDRADRCAADLCKGRGRPRASARRAASPAATTTTTSSSASSSRSTARTTRRDASPTRSGRGCRRSFPTGVCDWSKPGVGQQPTIPWLTYQDARGQRHLRRAPDGPAAALQAAALGANHRQSRPPRSFCWHGSHHEHRPPRVPRRRDRRRRRAVLARLPARGARHARRRPAPAPTGRCRRPTPTG